MLGYFVFVKVVNFRLHRALGRDFVDREDEEGKKPEDAKPSKDQVESMRMADLSEAVESDDKEEGLKEGVSDNHEEATVEVVVVPSRREDSGDLPKPPANDLPQPPASDLPQPPASDLPQPPAFMKETSEDMAKLGGASLSQSSSPSDEGGATIELSSVDRNHSKQGEGDRWDGEGSGWDWWEGERRRWDWWEGERGGWNWWEGGEDETGGKEKW